MDFYVKAKGTDDAVGAANLVTQVTDASFRQFVLERMAIAGLVKPDNLADVLDTDNPSNAVASEISATVDLGE